ncbi:xanthine dehydrogenase family protein molybdopterin-binding subunit [Herbiconiux solani]|uniref:xanthine dehydrogenase family protein molybdopterin-binding subunit n=1 Tax=Herbiconiux solani TaxID=661329 RepID=UPI000824E385|nr:xanthine dehydrogenase family protein molybdopterin-binding subunit [Herbiconiux solani]
MSAAPPFVAVGAASPRPDGRQKVTGTATFTAEWAVAGLAHGALVMSGISRGAIRSIDSTAALAVPGVLAVVTHENAPTLAPYPATGAGFPLSGDGGFGEALQPLQSPRIHYGAQPVAVVVAETVEIARHAATLVHLEYDSEEPETVLDASSNRRFPEEFGGTDKLQRADADAAEAWNSSAVHVEAEYDTSIVHHNPIELLCTIAEWSGPGMGEGDPEGDGEGPVLTLHDTCRGVQMLRDFAAHSFSLDPDDVVVISTFIGGAFGSKAWSFHNPLLVALAARVVGRPVKIEWRRQQVYSTGGHRPGTRQTLRLGADAEGHLQSVSHDTRTHTSTVSGYTEFGARMTKMMYATPHLAYSTELASLNLPSPSVMRGPGFLPGSFALESAMDELAHELGHDPVQLRLANYATADPDTGQPFSNKHLRECYERGAELFGWSDRPTTPGSRRAGDAFVGFGMSSAMHPAEQRAASASVTLLADGTAVGRSATHELGNGAYSVFRLIAADAVGLPLDRVRFELGDSRLPSAPPTAGSVTTASVGPAVEAAGAAVIESLKRLARQLEGTPLSGLPSARVGSRDGSLYDLEHPERSQSFAEILAAAGLPSITAEGSGKPGPEREDHAFYSFGAVFAEVRVDADFGVVRVERLTGVYDFGRMINPTTARSQIMGGMIFGIGMALMEETVFDPTTGLPVVRNLADYHVPSCGDSPAITIEAVDVPDERLGALGAYGIGEMGCNGVPAAIANAVFNATGRRIRSLPMTPDKVMDDA